MRKISSLVIIVVGSFLIATGVGVWAASKTNHPAVGVGVKAAYVADSSEWTPAGGAPLFKP
jgi:hypothetical protein